MPPGVPGCTRRRAQRVDHRSRDGQRLAREEPLRALGPWSWLVAGLAVAAGGVQVDQGLAELRVVEDALEDGLVVVHAGDDGAEEPAAEHEAEVLWRVVAGLEDDLGSVIHVCSNWSNRSWSRWSRLSPNRWLSSETISDRCSTGGSFCLPAPSPKIVATSPSSPVRDREPS